ncbi:hypothetical protein BHM03_00034622 [Ensete ventricosum]|uniref:Uncharacterized protein n=1 Tax=Ensete ventricosum TaxID=4639 RepID=A0A445MJ80_ENSVE|nr:hypothetical protein BHM03_00034622 [Ensete ventricosum]
MAPLGAAAIASEATIEEEATVVFLLAGDAGSKEGQQLLQREMARLGATAVANRNGRRPMKRRGGTEVAGGSGKEERKVATWGRRWQLDDKGRKMAEAIAPVGAIGVTRGQHQQQVMWDEDDSWAMKRRGGTEVFS